MFLFLLFFHANLVRLPLAHCVGEPEAQRQQQQQPRFPLRLMPPRVPCLALGNQVNFYTRTDKTHTHSNDLTHQDTPRTPLQALLLAGFGHRDDQRPEVVIFGLVMLHVRAVAEREGVGEPAAAEDLVFIWHFMRILVRNFT